MTIFSSGAIKDADSHEVPFSKVEADKMPSKRQTGAGKDEAVQTDEPCRLVQDPGSRRPPGEHQASKEGTDLNSEEAVIDAPDAGPLSGKRVIRLSAGQDSHLQRESTPPANGSNDVLAQGRRREPVDLDSLEDNNGRVAPVGSRGEANSDGKTL